MGGTRSEAAPTRRRRRHDSETPGRSFPGRNLPGRAERHGPQRRRTRIPDSKDSDNLLEGLGYPTRGLGYPTRRTRIPYSEDSDTRLGGLGFPTRGRCAGRGRGDRCAPRAGQGAEGSGRCDLYCHNIIAYNHARRSYNYMHRSSRGGLADRRGSRGRAPLRRYARGVVMILML